MIEFDKFEKKARFFNEETNLPLNEIYSCNNFLHWLNKLENNFGWDNVKEILIGFVKKFKNGKIGFIVAEANVHVEGKRIPGVSFIRGKSCAILVVLKHSKGNYVLLTKQPRVPIGDYSLEIPAGVIEDNDIKSTSVRELQEEAGIDSNSIRILAPNPIYLSPGGSDEQTHLFYLEVEVDDDILEKFQNKETGLRDKGELIELKVITFEEAKKIVFDAKSLLSFYLYENLSKTNS